MTSAEITEELDKTLEFDGYTSELDGMSSDEGDDTFVPVSEVDRESESSDEQTEIADEEPQSRNVPPWSHTSKYEPLPPAPAFEVVVWQGKDQDVQEYFLRHIPLEFF